jgi:hypothetical protein
MKIAIINGVSIQNKELKYKEKQIEAGYYPASIVVW